MSYPEHGYTGHPGYQQGYQQNPSSYQQHPSNFQQNPSSYQEGYAKEPHYVYGNTSEPQRPRSHYEIPDDVDWRSQIPDDVKRAFLQKVYSILAIQLGLTAAVSAFLMFSAPARIFVLTHPSLLLLEFLLLFVMIFLIMWKKDEHPTNMWLLMAFTLVEAFMVGTVCAAYQQAGIGFYVGIAAGITCVVFVTLTLIVFWSGYDFGFMMPFLMAGLVIMLCWGLASWIFGFQPGFAYSAFGALLFSGFILWDTDQIMKKLGCDDYISASLSLYIDVINLFLNILSLLGLADR